MPSTIYGRQCNKQENQLGLCYLGGNTHEQYLNYYMKKYNTSIMFKLALFWPFTAIELVSKLVHYLILHDIPRPWLFCHCGNYVSTRVWSKILAKILYYIFFCFHTFQWITQQNHTTFTFHLRYLQWWAYWDFYCQYQNSYIYFFKNKLIL